MGVGFDGALVQSKRLNLMPLERLNDDNAALHLPLDHVDFRIAATVKRRHSLKHSGYPRLHCCNQYAAYASQKEASL